MSNKLSEWAIELERRITALEESRATIPPELPRASRYFAFAFSTDEKNVIAYLEGWPGVQVSPQPDGAYIVRHPDWGMASFNGLGLRMFAQGVTLGLILEERRQHG